MSEQLTKEQSVAALRTLADRIANGGQITKDEFAAAQQATLTAYEHGGLPPDTMTRGAFDKLSPKDKAEFLNQKRGKLIDVPSMPR